MEENKASDTSNLPAESCQVVKTILELHRHTVPAARTDASWVAISDFTVEVGKEQIAEYIRTWELPPCWIYSLDFLHSNEEERHTFYHYRARFSTPTPPKPIPGTASVYFVFDIWKERPPSEPVAVHFIVESNRLVHTPGRTRFTDQWLADVIESKAALRRVMDL